MPAVGPGTHATANVAHHEGPPKVRRRCASGPVPILPHAAPIKVFPPSAVLAHREYVEPVKGKPLERVGRKATGLSPDRSG